MGNRFWEFYLVRYLSGTIFGVIVVCYLLVNYDTEISKQFFVKDCNSSILKEISSKLFDTTDSIKINDVTGHLLKSLDSRFLNIGEIELERTRNEVTILSAIIIAIVGFLYMYISSMVILVLHMFRIYLMIPLRIIGIYFTAFRTKKEISFSLVEFYKMLATFRAKDGSKDQRLSDKYSDFPNVVKQARVNEYVESYKHLREHGNAFGIILSELFFAWYLISFDFKVKFFALWILCGFLAWFIGTYLEIKIVEDENPNTSDFIPDINEKILDKNTKPNHPTVD